jgi:hypothetical protein
VQGVGDAAERLDVLLRLLAPRVPGPVHLVREADDHGHAGALDPVHELGDVGRDLVGDRGEALARLEGEEEGSADPADLLAGGLDVPAVGRVERDVGERHGDPGVAAEQLGVLRERLPAPVGIDAEQRALGGDGVGGRAGGAGGQLGLPRRASGQQRQARDAEAGGQGQERGGAAAGRGGHRC